MMFEAPAERRRSDGWSDCDDEGGDERQGEKRTRQMGNAGIESSVSDGLIRWRVR